MTMLQEIASLLTGRWDFFAGLLWEHLEISLVAILIAVAGYLNFADVDLGFKDQETSTDSSSILEDVDYDLTDETALLDENGADGLESGAEADETGTPGEAVLTAASDFAAQAKLSREQVRSKNKADLQEIINSADIGDEQKQEAVNTMVAMTDTAEKEAAAELLLEAKGFENAVVNLTGETADIVVPESDLDDAKRAQIEDIVKRKTGIAAENIVITPLNGDEETSASAETSEEEIYEDETEETSADSSGDTGTEEYEDETVYEDEGGQYEESSGDYVIETEGIYD